MLYIILLQQGMFNDMPNVTQFYFQFAKSNQRLNQIFHATCLYHMLLQQTIGSTTKLECPLTKY